MAEKVSIFWFRRDLRLHDNVGLQKALQGDHPVLPIFIFDQEILNELPENDARVNFIYDTLQNMRKELKKNGSGIAMFYGKPEPIFKELLSIYEIQQIICNRDYEPYAKSRDEKIRKLAQKNEIGFNTFKDQVIFEEDEIVKANGDPYIVYTPYMKSWKAKFTRSESEPVETKKYLNNLYKNLRLPNLSLSDIGFKKSDIKIPDYDISSGLIQDYEDKRNFPDLDATSHLGPHLRFGTVGIREVVKEASAQKDEVFLQELIWREFFMQILWHFPNTVNESFKKQYDRIEWRNNPAEFGKWKEGKTGYPIVDAGMRQLNKTGYMHNRVRMVVASFLCKHLLIDWRWGEAYFAEKLLDYEMSSNVGNWQWAAGSGVDAAPYFRIFNPTTQIEKFDKQHAYIKKWIPELESKLYPQEIVDHKEARERCLRVYKAALE